MKFKISHFYAGILVKVVVRHRDIFLYVLISKMETIEQTSITANEPMNDLEGEKLHPASTSSVSTVVEIQGNQSLDLSKIQCADYSFSKIPEVSSIVTPQKILEHMTSHTDMVSDLKNQKVIVIENKEILLNSCERKSEYAGHRKKDPSNAYEQLDTVSSVNNEPCCTEGPDSNSDSQGVQLPTIGIIVVDDNEFNEQKCLIKTVSSCKIKDNDCLKKVSAKINMEPQILQIDNLSSGPQIESVQLNKLEGNFSVDGIDDTTVSLAADSKEPLVTSEVAQSVSDAVEISGRTVVSSVTAPTLPPSEIVHKVKKIKFLGKEVPIITQNNNGPCPLLAVLNALLLKVSAIVIWFLKLLCVHIQYS